LNDPLKIVLHEPIDKFILNRKNFIARNKIHMGESGARKNVSTTVRKYFTEFNTLQFN